MTYTTTTLGMKLAVPGSGQSFETAVVNNNFQLLENGIEDDRSRLSTLESSSVKLAGAVNLAGNADFATTPREAYEQGVPTIVGHRYLVICTAQGGAVTANNTPLISLAWATATNANPTGSTTGTQLARLYAGQGYTVGQTVNSMTTTDVFTATSTTSFVKLQGSASAAAFRVNKAVFEVLDLGI